MNKTKVQYAVIAHKELTQAQELVALWSSHLDQRLENLNDAEATEFRRRAASKMPFHS